MSDEPRSARQVNSGFDDVRTSVRQRLLLFLVSCFLGGLGGVLGSIVGNAGGKTGLFVGGIVGGLLGASSSGAVASARRWIPRSAAIRTSVGASIGFLAAALIATQTLGSPIGPVLSTSLIGLGALVGAGRHPGTSSNVR